MSRPPLRKVVAREQDFRSTQDFPDGWINETLECGHVHIEGIEGHPHDVYDDGVVKQVRRHRHQASRRQCQECKKEAKTNT